MIFFACSIRELGLDARANQSGKIPQVGGDETPGDEIIIRCLVDLEHFAVLGDDFATFGEPIELRDADLRDELDEARHQNGMSSSVVGATLATGAAGVVLWALCESAGMTLGVLGAFVNCQPDRPLDSHRPR